MTRAGSAEGQLLVVGVLVELRPPVQGDDDDLGPKLSRELRISQDPLLVDEIASPGFPARIGDAVEAKRVRQQPQPHRPSRGNDVENGGSRSFLGSACTAGVLEASGIQRVEGSVHASRSLIECVIRGGRACVVSGGGEGGKDLRRPGEGRIALVRPIDRR